MAEFAGRLVAIENTGAAYFKAGKGPYGKKGILFAVISKTHSTYAPYFGDRDPVGFSGEILFSEEDIPSGVVFSNASLQGVRGGKRIKMRLAVRTCKQIKLCPNYFANEPTLL